MKNDIAVAIFLAICIVSLSTCTVVETISHNEVKIEKIKQQCLDAGMEE